ncbi:MAG: site-2 protease family protein [Nanoarchaeota archaeon]|nr:site-2 protease family protein [Nanoarchaeota archaeon]
MNIDILSAVVFYSLLFLFYAKYKKRFVTQGKIFVLYKTKFGLKLMDRFSKVCPRIAKFFGDVGILVGFAGMATMFYILLKGTYNLIFVPKTVPIVSPVLPGIQIPGLPALSFWHWIISIFVVALVHEFSHGIYARLSNVKIKSSGFAFLGPILAAFVEPDENQLNKKKKREQLRLFAAGPFGNIVLFLVVFLVAGFIVNPLVASSMEYQGVKVISIEADSPVSETNIAVDDNIIGINDVTISNLDDFLNATQNLKPGDNVLVKTGREDYTLELTARPDDSNRGYMGVSVTPISVGFKPDYVDKYGNGLLSFFLWFSKLLFWIYVISFGIGLFNLLPLGPIDGGRMFHTALLFFTKNEKKAKHIWGIVSFICLALIVINLLPYILKVLISIFNLFV